MTTNDWTIDGMTLEEAVREIDEEGKYLTDWETEFIDSMIKWAEADREWSQRQYDTIKRIYNDRVLRHRR